METLEKQINDIVMSYPNSSVNNSRSIVRNKIERLLNYFHKTKSPYVAELLQQEGLDYDFDVTDLLD